MILKGSLDHLSWIMEDLDISNRLFRTDYGFKIHAKSGHKNQLHK